MEDTRSRRGMIRGGAAAVAAGAALMAGQTKAQAQEPMVKHSPYPAPNPPPAKKPMFSRAVAYGDVIFLSGIGYHKPGTIEDHTRGVLDEISKALADAGSSLQKLMKVNVYLADLKDYDAMNKVYYSYDWGDIPPVRTTVAVAGVPGNSLIEIDVIGYI
ncbi:MAG: RidA family protein [Alphaproteobacteria bacterium]|nr:RidA family protein [Alphaproteobacteria bacterium]